MMKVTIDFDLTPAEAREIFGLPDFSGLHQSLTADMLKKCQQDPQMAFDTFIKPAMEQGISGFSAYQNLMASFMNPRAAKSGTGTTKE
ncbi:DUF6489 family protein [Glaciecola siphonariae]|uniref:DUF6489 family protein n=1 Tax=Glaciecola siphonariae TaxID=521012 RepID=A0ABV9M040_9ALTE